MCLVGLRSEETLGILFSSNCFKLPSHFLRSNLLLLFLFRSFLPYVFMMSLPTKLQPQIALKNETSIEYQMQVTVQVYLAYA
jgi:hypothetical protein